MSLGCVYPGSLCYNLTQQAQVGRLSVRDIAYDASMDHAFVPGIDLNTALFPVTGYSSDAISMLSSLLDAGLRSLYLNVYWGGNAWFVCPGVWTSSEQNATTSSTSTSTSTTTTTGRVFCDPALTFNALIGAVNDYIVKSDTTVAVSMLHIHLRPQVWSDAPSNITQFGDTSLNGTLSRGVGSRIFTPSYLNSSRMSGGVTELGTLYTSTKEEWPTLKQMLLSWRSRLVITVANNGYDIGNANDLHEISFGLDTTPESEVTNYLGTFPFASGSATSEAEWSQLMTQGLSPILNSTMDWSDVVKMLDTYGSWGWIGGGPVLYSQDQRLNMSKDGVHYACAMLARDGMFVGDCNFKRKSLCRSNSGFLWALSSDNRTYYSADCPKGYYFSQPKTALEMRTVTQMLNDTGEEVWIDLNSLFYPNCWVTGGALTVCPYNVVQKDRNGVASLTVAATAVVCMIIAIILFEWDRVSSPLRCKQKPPDYYQTPEGIPS